MRATSAAGDANYVGTVGWSGELGYGVRAPEATQAEADTPKAEKVAKTVKSVTR